MALVLMALLPLVACAKPRHTYSAPWVPEPWSAVGYPPCDEIFLGDNRPCVYCADTAEERRQRAVPAQCSRTMLVTWTKEKSN